MLYSSYQRQTVAIDSSCPRWPLFKQFWMSGRLVLSIWLLCLPLGHGQFKSAMCRYQWCCCNG